MMTYIQKAMQDVAMQIRDAQEEYLLAFFGSYEMAKLYGKYFTIEEEADPITVAPEEGYPENYYSISYSWRIRVLTAEELEAAGVEKPWPTMILELQKVALEKG
jgi:hypothetical protein